MADHTPDSTDSPGASDSTHSTDPFDPVALLAKLTAVDPEMSALVTEIVRQTVEGFTRDIFKTWPARPSNDASRERGALPPPTPLDIWWQCNFAVIDAQSRWLRALNTASGHASEASKE